MRQGNILNEAMAVSLATFLGEAIRLVILIVALQLALSRDWALRRVQRGWVGDLEALVSIRLFRLW
jgi:hypothetical protein